jgi:hypothetical protein
VITLHTVPSCVSSRAICVCHCASVLLHDLFKLFVSLNSPHLQAAAIALPVTAFLPSVVLVSRATTGGWNSAGSQLACGLPVIFQ